MKPLVRPILVSGPGKSGTTLLLRVLSTHPQLAWFSGWTNRFPRLHFLSALSRVNDIARLERGTREVSRWPRPSEAYGVWDHYFPGFSKAERDWGRADLAESGAHEVRQAMIAHLRWQGKDRFLTKYTGWPRYGFMHGIADDAELVSIDRDPRAVVHSYEKYKWWFKASPDALAAMSPIERIDFYADKYLAFFRAKRDSHDARILQLRHEVLVLHPQRELRSICERLGLDFPSTFAASIETFEFDGGRGDAWRKKLTADEVRHLTTRLEEPIRALGYSA